MKTTLSVEQLVKQLGLDADKAKKAIKGGT